MGKKSKKVLKSKRGMTGIETAIILIAFVVVAATFAFVVLNMGFFTAQRSKSVISSGLAEASSAVEIDGSVLGYGNQSAVAGIAQSRFIDKIVIYIKLSSGRQPVELNPGKMVISYHNNRVAVDNVYATNGSACNVTEIVGDGDAILEEGEKFKISINLRQVYSDLGNDTDVFLIPHDTFVVEIKPPAGAILTVERLIPPTIDDVIDLG